MKCFTKKNVVEFASFFGKFILANITALVVVSTVICFYYNKSSTCLTLNGRPFAHHRSYSHYCQAYEGFCYGTLDFNGFNNLYCVANNIQILSPDQRTIDSPQIRSLLLGSSEMYGVHVPMNKHCCYLINQKNPQSLVYNIGASGQALVDLVKIYEDALDYFQPRRYAIIETRRLPQYAELQSLDAAERVLLNHLENKTLIFISEHIYAVRWIMLNIQKGLQGFKKNTKTRVDNKEEWNDKNVFCLRNFLCKFSEPSKARNVQPILFYHPRPVLLQDGSITFDDPKVVELYKNECDKQGIVFLYLGDRFMREYEERNILPYGFWNTSPNFGHLNKDGHRMIADELCKVIERLEEERKENVQ